MNTGDGGDLSDADFRSLSVAKSEYRKLCEELGGPAEIDNRGIREIDFERYCREYPLSKVGPILARFQPDGIVVRKHWPWAAFTISRYVFEIAERARYQQEPSPKQVRDLFSTIESTSRDLLSALSRLQELAGRLSDPSAPGRRGHIAWLDAYVAQGVAGRPSNDVSEEQGHLVFVQNERMKFAARLAQIQGTAKAAQKRVDSRLLNRERRQANPGLANLVFRCASIWKGLTNRPPSANKIHTHARGRREPDLVVFVKEIAKFGSAKVPTRAMIATALKNLSS
jgi:hypothetical protein